MVSNIAIDAVDDIEWQSNAGLSAASSFRFLPSELVFKCRALIESYHEMLGYGCMPDILWQSDARNIIVGDCELTRLFSNAAKSRSARRANDSLILVATIVLSLEALARDFAGWGKRFPTVKLEAESLLGGAPLRQRVWLLDLYLYPSLGIHREFAAALAPSNAAEQAMARS